jgi:nicotinate-nucleotide pyrophosphorylase (carboxylating)
LDTTREHLSAVDIAIIDLALAEDIGSGDLTARVIPEPKLATGLLTTRENMVVCGAAWFDAVFARLGSAVSSEWFVADGDEVMAGTRLCRLHGQARALLTGERTALNLLQTLCGTATRARRFANAVAGTGCRILDTRKTLPGLRLAQKYAVRCGGCFNHRKGLYDGILIKENHILAAGSIAQAVAAARALKSGVTIEVEVESLPELLQALEAEVERILLDNFDLAMTREAVAVTAGRAQLEASGNVDLGTIRELAETGVDFISVGGLTKNVQAVDLSLRIRLDE